MGKPPRSRLADQYQTYPTANAAAVAALRGIDNKLEERGGGILYNKEQNVYAPTEPVGQDGGSHFQATLSVPKGWSLHSTYHTHPAGHLSTQFSDNDIDTATQLKAPSYVLAREDDKVRMFDPSSSKVKNDSDLAHPGGGRYAIGSTVDETPPAPPVAAETPPAAAAAPTPPAAAVPISGSRRTPMTMREFVDHHRAQTTKYKHKIVHVK